MSRSFRPAAAPTRSSLPGRTDTASLALLPSAAEGAQGSACRGRASGVRSACAALCASLAVIAAFAALPSAASAERGHVFSATLGYHVNKSALETAGRESEADVCPAPGHPADVCQAAVEGSGDGQLSSPTGIALDEAAGVLYVADQGNDRVELLDSRTGAYLGQIDGTSAQGTGQLASGSKEVTAATATSGAFAVGQALIAPGLPAGTKIEAIPSPGTLLLTQAATATEAASLAASRPFGFNSEEGHKDAQIAVDDSCSQHSPPLSALTTPTCAAYDPSYGDLYVVDEGNHVVDKFSPSGEFLGAVPRSPETTPPIPQEYSPLGVAVTPDGRLWVSENYGPQAEKHYGVDEYSSARPAAFLGFHPIPVGPASVGASLGDGLAVAGADAIFVRKEAFGAALEFERRVYEYEGRGHSLSPLEVETEPGVWEFPPKGTPPFDAEAAPSTGLAIEAGSEDVYVDEAAGARVGRYSSALEALETVPVPGGGGEGIAVDGPATTLYVASAPAAAIVVLGPQPAAAPAIEDQWVASVAATTASVGGKLDPRSDAGEEATSYWLEYGPCEGGLAGCATSPYPSRTPTASLPAAYGSLPVSLALEGLGPHTIYHLRLAAENSHDPGAPVLGPEARLTTQPAAPSPLPDDRGWELVSPPEKHGARLHGISEVSNPQAAASGGAIAYQANAPTEADPPSSGPTEEVLSARGPGGWSSRDVSSPILSPTGTQAGAPQEFRLFSPSLATAVINPFGAFDPSLSPEATEQGPYLRSLFAPSGPPAFCAESCFAPLLTAADALPGFGLQQDTRRPCPPEPLCGPEVLGASPDASHVVLVSRTPLLEGAPEGAGWGELYEYSEGRVLPVSVRPGAHGGSGGPWFPPASIPALGGGLDTAYAARGAVSADGSRVFFHEAVGSAHHLYLRDTATEETLQLDKVEGGSGGSIVDPVFQLANAQGTVAYFTDTQALTPGAGASSGAPDLYRCEIIASEATGELECALTDLTPKTGGEAAGVLGRVIGASSEGPETLYFVAEGALASNSVDHGAGPEAARPGTPNLYRWRPGEGLVFVAGLSPEDSPDWGRSGSLSALGELAARVSPDGRWLAFMSERPLTGYDNRDAASGNRDEEAFLYHAGEGPEGTLACASCDPTGARPHGAGPQAEGNNFPVGSPVGNNAVWETGHWLAAYLPGWSPYFRQTALYQSRYLSDGGRLFFDSPGALVPGDSNGTWDVYQYEPPGGGPESPPGDDCVPSSPSYSPASAGCVSLVSSGTSPSESGFVDASESGEDVFFLTAARLTDKDVDTALDLYDARVGGGEAEEAKPVRCVGDECQQPAASPPAQTPGSLSYQGPEEGAHHPAARPKPKGHPKHHKKKHKAGRHAKRHSHKERGGGR